MVRSCLVAFVFVDAPTELGIRRLNTVFATQPAKTAHGNAQGLAGVLIALVHAGHALDLLSSYASSHILLLDGMDG